MENIKLAIRKQIELLEDRMYEAHEDQCVERIQADINKCNRALAELDR